MKFRFKIQQYQTDAVDSVVRAFQGQPYSDGVSYRRDLGEVKPVLAPVDQQISLFPPDQISMDEVDDTGYLNEMLQLTDEQLLKNIRVVGSDLIFPGHHHTVFASLGEAYAKNCAVCHAPSKTFNLAGLSFSCIMIPDETHRQRFDAMFNRYCRANPTFFAPVAAKAAWEHGEEWLKECLAYIQGNEAFVRSFAEKTWGGKVWIAPLEGTYLLWMDLHALEPDAEKLDRRMIEEAGVALDGGTMFGQEGAGFQRINLAAPRSIIREAMERMAKAFA